MIKESEREELIWRIVVFIVGGIILSVWAYLVMILIVIHFFVVLFTEKRNPDLSNFCEYWSSEVYRFTKYMTFQTDERPFPFANLKKIGKFEK